MAVRKKYGKPAQNLTGWSPPPGPHRSLPRVEDVQVKLRAGQRPLKRLSTGAPRTFLSNPQSRNRHCRRFAPTPRLADELKQLILENVYEFDRLEVRRVKTAVPGSRGAPAKSEIMVLVSGLLAAYYRCSGGKNVTRHYRKDVKFSSAGRFLQPIFDDLGLKDPDSWIKKHRAEKLVASNKS